MGKTWRQIRGEVRQGRCLDINLPFDPSPPYIFMFDNRVTPEQAIHLAHPHAQLNKAGEARGSGGQTHTPSIHSYNKQQFRSSVAQLMHLFLLFKNTEITSVLDK